MNLGEAIARVAKLEAENELLQAKLDRVGRAIGVGMRLPAAWGLTPIQGLLVGLLLKRDIVTRDLCQTMIEDNLRLDPVLPRTIDTHMTRLRGRLPAPIMIKTSRGEGYYMPPASKAALRRAIDRCRL